ncbi:hypothetical protein BGW36DRAFT_293703 [Talaromyces proteolyticus]|uniref:CST complex subunit Stn1 N-terminal domain-containing protein n=1 Tax=Talaromyces proteolyticus TaxID=1131652 RepID=A0AAD4Q223_9EURO|nr:uncharacterized protein BGW36DRAFT_293703 [Talaromyces proteolyticus]KAH8699284.1 hypothetical protein BGW36DRAFT_293703 [Talaromyces proteolyticus]
MAENASAASNTNTVNENANIPFYPAFCFQASPTHFTWVKMGIAEIHRLRIKKGFEGQNIFFYQNHPIQFVSVAGIVVTREEYERRTVLVVDDSSGENIEVVILKATAESSRIARDIKHDINEYNGENGSLNVENIVHVTSTTRTSLDITQMQIGAVVKIKGTLSTFRKCMQIVLERFWVLPDTNAEVKFWDERSRFLVDVLSAPWVLTSEMIEALRTRAHEEEMKVAKERRIIVGRQRIVEEREKKDYKRIIERWEKEERLREKEAAWIRESNKRFEQWWAQRKGNEGSIPEN